MDSGPASVFRYGEAGKEATIYKVKIWEKNIWLKGISPERLQDKRLVEILKKSEDSKVLNGFHVAGIVLLLHICLIQKWCNKFPELKFCNSYCHG